MSTIELRYTGTADLTNEDMEQVRTAYLTARTNGTLHDLALGEDWSLIVHGPAIRVP